MEARNKRKPKLRLTTESDAVVDHQEVPNGQAAVETVGALEDRSGDQRPARRYQNTLKRRFKDNVVLETPKDGCSRTAETKHQ
jgi:hypothetical protein